MQFRPKTEYAPPPAPSGARVQLAEAIAERNEARQSVIDARDAEEKARLATYAAEHDADELRRQANESGSASDVVAAISGGVDDILALERPRETLRAKIEGMVERVAAWRRAANLAEQQIPIRTAALDRAERKVVDAAKAVVASAVDVDRLLAEAKTGADWLRDRRALFLFLMSVLPHGPEHDALADFMERPWLQDELNDAWKRNAGIKPYAQAFERLRRDADAPLPDSAP